MPEMRAAIEQWEVLSPSRHGNFANTASLIGISKVEDAP
jgi:hypothetical protein